jgi:hypothetical protein
LFDFLPIPYFRLNILGMMIKMSQKIKVIQYGIGSMACKITQYLIKREIFEVVGAIDRDPNKIGKDLGDLAGLPEQLNVKISNDVQEVLSKDADIVILTTSSRLALIKEQIMTCFSHGKNVISTCEELSYPWIKNPNLADEIDRTARGVDVSVLGTGANPGFLMDFLPMVMTGICQEVNSVRVERVQNAGERRKPFQNKIGAGLTFEEFEGRIIEKSIGHTGLTESIHLIAANLGWQLDNAQDIIRPVTTDRPVRADDLSIDAGKLIGIEQTGVGYIEGKEVIHLLLRATIGERNPYDKIYIEGKPVIDSLIRGGIEGDSATAAIIVNAILQVIGAPPGLRTMADMNPVSFFKR